MTKSTRNKSFFHISNHLLLLPFTHFTFLTVQKWSSKFITTSLAYFRGKGYFMCFIVLIQTFDNYIKIFSLFMLAKLSLFEVCLKLICTNNTCMMVLEWILDNMCTLVANFAKLTNFVYRVRFLFAGEFDNVGQTFLKIVGTQGHVFGLVVDHI